MKPPVFSGPSGRKPQKKRPGIGDELIFGDRPGEKFKILEVRGSEARVEVDGVMRWGSLKTVEHVGSYTPDDDATAGSLKEQYGVKLKQPGDSLKISGGTLTLISVDESGMGYFEAVDKKGTITRLRAQRNGNLAAHWGKVAVTIPTSDESALEFDLGRKWEDGFVNAMKTQRLPMRDSILSGKGVSDIARRLGSDLRSQRAEADRQAAHAKVKHRKIPPISDDELKADIAEVSRILKGGIKLEKPQGSSLHHLMQYIEDTNGGQLVAEDLAFIKSNFQIMVVEHDWAKAFDGTEGFSDDGEVPMPFDYTCFEFRANGLRFLVLIGLNEANQNEGMFITGIHGRWYVNDERFKFINGKFSKEALAPLALFERGLVDSFLETIGAQIRAVCIMLDAGVAEAEEEAPSAAINASRRRSGRTELRPYHVVRLGVKHRRTEARVSGEPSDRKKPRMHYRRGHWRHFDSGVGQEQYTDADGYLRSKTYIHWMLVGDPDLGFVDKEYRL